jgi:hypothetical protein
MKKTQVICNHCKEVVPIGNHIEINFHGKSSVMFDVVPVEADFCCFECAKCFIEGLNPNSSWNAAA